MNEQHNKFVWEEYVKTDLKQILSSVDEAESLVNELMRLKREHYINMKQNYDNKRLSPSIYKKEIKRFNNKLKQAEKILYEVFPEMSKLKETRLANYDNWIENLKGIQERVEIELPVIADIYYNYMVNLKHYERYAIRSAVPICRKYGIKDSPSRNSKFHAIAQWLLADPDNDNDTRGYADLREFIKTALKN